MRYVFGDYSLDPTHYELRQAGRLVPIEARVFEVLAYLVQHAGQTVPTEELLAQLYPQQFAPVERLTNAVTHARKALGETSQAPRYIQTARRTARLWPRCWFGAGARCVCRGLEGSWT